MRPHYERALGEALEVDLPLGLLQLLPVVLALDLHRLAHRLRCPRAEARDVDDGDHLRIKVRRTRSYRCTHA